MKAIGWTVAAFLLLPVQAFAQEFGVRGGVTSAPVFGFAGIRFAYQPGEPARRSPAAPERLRIRLEADLAGGPQLATMVTAAIESPRIHRSTLSWAPYFGGGLTFFLAHRQSLSHSGDRLGGGWCALFGVENRRRLSLEIQINFWSGDIPRAFGIVGYRFH